MRVSPDVNALAAEIARLQRSGRLPAETARAFEEALKGAASAPAAPVRETARAAFFAPVQAVAPAPASAIAASAPAAPLRPGSLLDIKV